jgi:hypothetical protein
MSLSRHFPGMRLDRLKNTIRVTDTSENTTHLSALTKRFNTNVQGYRLH